MNARTVATGYAHVTEMAGERITRIQLKRQVERYRWATEFCRNRDVLDIACGAGPGLGMFARVARRLEAVDIDPDVLAAARRLYGDRISLNLGDAQAMSFPDGSFDIIVIFEALYYLADADRFAAECRRVLRPGGRVLVATANRDLYDFTPSPLAHRYFNPPELSVLFGAHGFACAFYGGSRIETAGWVYRILRPVKALATRLGLMPKTMAGKQWLKRLVFGSLVEMSGELTGSETSYEAPVSIPAAPDLQHHVVYCVATRGE